MRASTMATHATENILLDAFWPRTTPVQNVLLIVAGSLLVALCAQISFPLPFSPVPISAQNFAVLLLGAAYGARRSAASLMLYLAAGAAGLPVFAPGGLPGLARFLGPTGGYLLAYPAAAFLLGWLLERFPQRGWWIWLVAVLAAETVIFTGGMAQLKFLLQTSWAETARLGLVPFLPGELLKVALLSVSLPASRWALGRRRTVAP